MHAMRPGHQLLLFALYQLPADQMMIAQLWSVDRPRDVLRVQPAESTFDPIDARRRVWRYDTSTDLHELARQIVCEVTGWLEPNESTR